MNIGSLIRCALTACGTHPLLRWFCNPCASIKASKDIAPAFDHNLHFADPSVCTTSPRSAHSHLLHRLLSGSRQLHPSLHAHWWLLLQPPIGSVRQSTFQAIVTATQTAWHHPETHHTAQGQAPQQGVVGDHRGYSTSSSQEANWVANRVAARTRLKARQAVEETQAAEVGIAVQRRKLAKAAFLQERVAAQPAKRAEAARVIRELFAEDTQRGREAAAGGTDGTDEAVAERRGVTGTGACVQAAVARSPGYGESPDALGSCMSESEARI